MTTLTSLALLVVSALASFYAGFCLLGGPDGALLSRSSFAFGVPALLVAVALVYASTRVMPCPPYMYAPALVPVFAWLAAVVFSQKVGFQLWLFGTPVIVVATLAFRIVGLTANAGQGGSL
jgi:hypothetical protein